MYNVIYDTCNLYDMSERQSKIVEGNLNQLLRRDPQTYGED